MELKEFRSLLSFYGYVETDPSAVVSMWLVIRDRGNGHIPAVLFDGPPGVGKTYLAEITARALGARKIFFQFFRGASREDLLLDLDLVRVVRAMSGAEEPESYRDMVSLGVLPTAAEWSQLAPTVLILDELDKAHPSTDALLLDFLQNARLVLPHVGEFRVDTRNLLVVLTKNDERDIAEPLLRRVRPVRLSWPPEQTEISMIRDNADVPVGLAKTLVTLAGKVRALGLPKQPSTPELIRLARDVAALVAVGADADTVGKIAADTFFPLGDVPNDFNARQIGGILLARGRGE